MTPAQVRAARGFLGWARDELKAASGVSVETIKNIEHGRFHPHAETANKLRLTFAHHGVGFFDILSRNPVWGVLLQPPHAPEQDNWELSEADRAMHTRFALAKRMAMTIVAVRRQGGQCVPADLEAQGFTPAEIAEGWRMASALADVETETPASNT